jgi:signal transduction histidine kinase
MIPSSVRWRLPVSYAAIVLLATLTLGGLLLVLLSGYYSRQESAYLSSNATAMGVVMDAVLEQAPPQVLIESQLSSFAILSQSRARLLDIDRQILADSGSLAEQNGVFVFDWDLSSFPSSLRLTAHTNAGQVTGDGSPVAVQPAEQVATQPSTGQTTPASSLGQSDVTAFMYAASAAGTPFGFGLTPDAASGEGRSNKVVQEPFYDNEGQLIGYIELSEGPAYGREIIERVAVASTIAGGLAIVVSGAVGWRMSRQITSPLLALTETTTRMASGDLSARVELSQPGELGLLATSFNIMADYVDATVQVSRRFAADAAHELQTPLTALQTNLELAPQDAFVDEAQTQARRIGTLAQSLLDLSRLETVNPMSARESVDLVSLVQGQGEIYSSRAQQAGLGFDLDLPHSPVKLLAHGEQLRQAVSNLLDNAIKFTAEGGRVKLRLRQEQGHVRLSVEDTGIGVPEEDVPFVASRFRRGRNASNYTGSGLGLAIVKAVVDNHGGRMSIQSREGQGTVISLDFPGS